MPAAVTLVVARAVLSRFCPSGICRALPYARRTTKAMVRLEPGGMTSLPVSTARLVVPLKSGASVNGASPS